MTQSEFFKENEVHIGEGKDFTVKPPVYYSSLTNAFFFYFQTYADRKLNYHLLLDPERWNKKTIAFELTGSDENIVFTLLGFHRFIELLLKDVLKRLDPFLAVRMPESSRELYLYYDKRLGSEDLKSVEYSEAMNRFKYAFTHYEKNSDVYLNVLQKYEFLTEQRNQEMLRELVAWRNRIMHNGSALPNLFAFEFLITQGIVPIIINILNAEKDMLKGYLPPYLTTASGIPLLEILSQIKFTFHDFTTKEKQKDTGLQLIKVAHLKEMGRAAFQFEINTYRHQSMNEALPLIKERLAKRELVEAKGVQHVIICPCCAVQSLVVYTHTSQAPWRSAPHSQKWCGCLTCDYAIRDDIGDPYQFGITSYPFF